MASELRHASRLLFKNPGTSLLAVLVLAFAIGGVTAVFQVVNAALLRRFPHIDVDRWAYVQETAVAGGLQEVSASIPNFRDWRDQSRSFEGMFLWQWWNFNVSGSVGLDPERVEAAIVTGEIFEALRVRPAAGRMLYPGEEPEAPSRRIVISHSLWQRRFGGDPEIAGRKIELNLVPFTVVGVAPAGFTFPPESRTEIWVPFGARSIANAPERSARGYGVAAKLKNGVTFEQAQAEINTIAARLAAQYPEDKGFGVRLTPLREAISGPMRGPLLLLLGALGLVLFLACVNIANLQVARDESRRKEYAVRVALGCSRSRLAKQILFEILLLVGGGALLGAALTPVLVRWLLSSVPERDVRWMVVTADWTVLLAALTVILVSTLFAGLVPAWRASRTDARAAMIAGGSSSSGSFALGQYTRRGFIAVQVALSLVPLVAASLLVQSFVRLQQQKPGFEPEHRTTLSFLAPRARYADPASVARLTDRVRHQVGQAPGVKALGLGQTIPFGDGVGWFQAVTRQDPRSVQNLASLPHVHYNVVTPGYVGALGIKLKAGRDFNDADVARGQQVVLINETLANRYFPGEDPIGKTMWVGHAQALPETAPRIVVGVMGDARWLNLTTEVDAAAWVPIAQQSIALDVFRSLFLCVHTTGSANTAVSSIREQIRKVDPDLALTNIQTLETRLSNAMWRYRLAALAMTALSLLALTIALLGVFATISFVVNRRMHEMGIRLALGSTKAGLVRLVVGEGVWLVAFGLVAGGVAAYGLTRYLSSLLFGITATDVVTFTAAAVGLGAAAILACYLPARKAAGADPASLLR